MPATLLKPLDFLILLALLERERHGYAIRREISEITGGEVTVDAGNLYRSLKRLLEAELLATSSRRRARDANDERRRYYRLTASGKRALAAEAHRLSRLLHLGKVRRLLSETGP